MKHEQYVCQVCGFNMIGFHPDNCPFCGAARRHFITAEECSARYRVVGTPVNGKVTRLNSHPALGIEHAAYRIETDRGASWIDSPSSFDPSLQRADMIFFTHHHFLGASNLYREHFNAEVRIHHEDSATRSAPLLSTRHSGKTLSIRGLKRSTSTATPLASPSTSSRRRSSSATTSSLPETG